MIDRIFSVLGPVSVYVLVALAALAGLYLLVVAVWPMIEARIRRRAARRAWRTKR